MGLWLSSDWVALYHFWDSTHQGYHMVSFFLCQNELIEYENPQAPEACLHRHDFIVFDGWVPISLHIPHHVYASIYGYYSGFQILATVNTAAMNVVLLVSFPVGVYLDTHPHWFPGLPVQVVWNFSGAPLCSARFLFLDTMHQGGSSSRQARPRWSCVSTFWGWHTSGWWEGLPLWRSDLHFWKNVGRNRYVLGLKHSKFCNWNSLWNQLLHCLLWLVTLFKHLTRQGLEGKGPLELLRLESF